MNNIFLSNKAEKSLKKLDKSSQRRVQKAIDILKTDVNLGIKLSGILQNYYKIKIPPLRIIYSVERKDIYIKAIGYRGDIYKSINTLLL